MRVTWRSRTDIAAGEAGKIAVMAKWVRSWLD